MENIICHFFIFFAEEMILWQYTFGLFADKCSPRRKAAALCALYLILFAASFLDSKWLNVALYLIANFVFMSVWCCSNWYSAFFHSFILTAVMIRERLSSIFVNFYLYKSKLSS